MTYAPWLTTAVERLDQLVEDGVFAVGAQLWVCHGGEVVCDLALGDAVGGLMGTDTVHNSYCLSKPILALALAGLAAGGSLDLHAPLGDLDLPGWAIPPFDCTVLDVLDHQVGLDTLAAMEYRVAPQADRTALVAERIASAQRRPAYSEILGGLILEEVVRSVTDCESVSEEVAELVLSPNGISGIAIDAVDATKLYEAGLVSVPFGGLPDRHIPLLFELLPQSLNELRPAFGVLCSARSIGCVMEMARTALGDRSSSAGIGGVLNEMLERRHPAFEDKRAKRMILAAGGFMVDASFNQLASMASPRSFGHNAGMAQAVAFADPDVGLTVSLYLNGAEVGAVSSLADRVALVDDVYRGQESK